MSHEEEDDIIILSVTLPKECEASLDNLAANGAYGSSREEVVRHFVCSRLGVDLPRPQLPDAPVGDDDVAGVAAGPPESDSEEGAK